MLLDIFSILRLQLTGRDEMMNSLSFTNGMMFQLQRMVIGNSTWKNCHGELGYIGLRGGGKNYTKSLNKGK